MIDCEKWWECNVTNKPNKRKCTEECEDYSWDPPVDNGRGRFDTNDPHGKSYDYLSEPNMPR